MKKRTAVLLMLSILVLMLGACTQKEEQQAKGLKIVTSFYPVYAMVKEVSGDLNDVRMIQSSTGIHSFEPSANDVAAIYDADVFVYHSHTLESWAGSLDPNLQKSKVKVLELSELDKEHKEIYQKNAKNFITKAQELTQKYQPIFDKAKQKTFVTQHTAFSYLAKRFGLQQLGIAGISPEQEPNARQLTEIQEFVKTYKVKTIFTESNASSKVAETLVKSTGVRLKTLNPLEADPQNDKNYLENLEENMSILAKELK